MKLEVGKTYRDGWGKEYRIMGPTRDNPAWVWSAQGFWFDQATGCRVTYYRDSGSEVMPPGPYQLCEEMPE